MIFQVVKSTENCNMYSKIDLYSGFIFNLSYVIIFCSKYDWNILSDACYIR